MAEREVTQDEIEAVMDFVKSYRDMGFSAQGQLDYVVDGDLNPDNVTTSGLGYMADALGQYVDSEIPAIAHIAKTVCDAFISRS